MLDDEKKASAHSLLILGAAAVLCGAALLAGALDCDLFIEARIFLGFFLLFIAPGLVFMSLFFPSKRFMLIERLVMSIALSMGVWALPGLFFYSVGSDLDAVLNAELIILGAMFALAFVRHALFRLSYDFDPAELYSPGGRVSVYVIGLLLLLLAAWTGSFRGAALDWDYYNYISAVKKLVVWGRASVAHFAYADAPPDPIHSYNTWALQWALISRLFEINPVELYTRSASLTVPASAVAFYALGRRLFCSAVSRTALFLFAAYHVIYGGLLFLGRTTFYPADSQWLIVFPCCLALFLRYVQGPGAGLLLGLALSVLGMFIVHVLWGLCFYLTLLSFLIAIWFRRTRILRTFAAIFRSGRGLHLSLLLVWVAAPVVLVLVDAAVMYGGDREGFTPLLGGGADFSAWVYAGAFVIVPLLYFVYLAAPFRPRRISGHQQHYTVYKIIAALSMCVLLALPYFFIRAETIQATNWEQFGRNPYRAFISSSLFFLNPYQRSLQNPNMTFYPLYILGYICIPFLWAATRRKTAPLMALAVMVAVPLICFHPVPATLFAKHFSLGYLRRLLRLMAFFSMFPAALLIHGLVNVFFNEERRKALNISACILVSVLVSLAAVRFHASPPYYNDLLKKTVVLTRSFAKDSLIYDDTPFEVIEDAGWFEDDAIIFSDVWTSYRLTAHLPQFVAVQHKPGTGVPDQDQRRLLESEFFEPGTPVERMREILDHFSADGVIVNRNPTYDIYGYVCGRPEAAGKLKRDSRHFELLFDKGDWVILRYKAAGKEKGR